MINSIQEYLDLLVKTSKNGGFPASCAGICRYKTPDGRKCAIGLVIKDEDYSNELEGLSAYSICQREPNILPECLRGKSEELREIQQAHDDESNRCSPTRGWNHERFMKDLLECQLFNEMKPTES